MAVTQKALHLPPFISTSWSHVLSLHMEQDEGEPLLVVTLVGGSQICIPQLSESLIHQLFQIHAAILEGRDFAPIAMTPTISLVDALGPLLEHFDVPCDTKPMGETLFPSLAALAEQVDPSEIEQLPQPNTGCPCLGCQVRGFLHHFLQGSQMSTPEQPEEPHQAVWKSWVVEEQDADTYTVYQQQAPQSHFRVSLGTTVQCSCGKAHCEHILAVLHT